jgi:hypothetical protein
LFFHFQLRFQGLQLQEDLVPRFDGKPTPVVQFNNLILLG